MNNYFHFYVYKQTSPFSDTYLYFDDWDISAKSFLAADKIATKFERSYNAVSRLKIKVSSLYSDAVYNGDANKQLLIPF